MADSSGQKDIRGLNIDKVAKGYADKVFIMKNFVAGASTNAREVRWYQKGVDFDPLLDSPDTTGITGSRLDNVADKARPVSVEQSWTRKQSYVKKYFVESPTISMEDIKDSDVDILRTNVQDLVRAVANQVDADIYDVLTESQSPTDIQTTASVAPWDTTASCNPIKDIMVAKRKISEYHYEISGDSLVLAMNPIEYEFLVDWLIAEKGSSIPGFSSEKVETGVVMKFLGCSVVVSTTVPTDSVAVFVRNRAATWKSFVGMTSVVMDDPGIGKKIRVWEEGVAILTDPKAVHLTTNTAA